MSNTGFAPTLTAAADFSATPCIFVRLNASGQVIAAADAEQAIGVLGGMPPGDTTGCGVGVEMCCVCVNMVVPDGVTINAQDNVTSNAAGLPRPAAGGEPINGVALATATGVADGSVKVPVLVQAGGN